MRIAQSYIHLNNLHFYAYHGVLPQEQVVGGDYSVSLRVAVDVAAAVEHDVVDVTLNYATLYEVVKREMLIPSALLEHVAGRIGQAVMDAFPRVTAVDLTVVKCNPPMGAVCDGAGVELHFVR